MKELSNQELYEIYLDAAKRCSSPIRDKPDEELAYDLFEEFDVGAVSYFHDNSLAKLSEAGLISDDAVAISREIRRTWMELQDTDWTYDQIRAHPKWNAFFTLVDRLLALLK